ncbi:hypothetical protein [Rhodanobacter sp. FW106-PBR-LB-2-11]|uniref:hypothetical protein n=1 Tax=Rhodanobacter sp. FW106-PBR-LB-2-11 TaxID=1524463 RepID=UPI0034E4014A
MTTSPNSVAAIDDEPATARESMRSARRCVTMTCIWTAMAVAHVLNYLTDGPNSLTALWVHLANLCGALLFPVLAVYSLWKAVLHGVRSIVIEEKGKSR